MLHNWTWEKQIEADKVVEAKRRELHFRNYDIDTAWEQHRKFVADLRRLESMA